MCWPCAGRVLAWPCAARAPPARVAATRTRVRVDNRPACPPRRRRARGAAHTQRALHIFHGVACTRSPSGTGILCLRAANRAFSKFAVSTTATFHSQVREPGRISTLEHTRPMTAPCSDLPLL